MAKKTLHAALVLSAALCAQPALAQRGQEPRPIPPEAAAALERAMERPPPAVRGQQPAAAPQPRPLDFNTPGAAPPVDVPSAVVPQTAQAAPPVPAEAPPCGDGRSLSDLLSPRCLESLRTTRGAPQAPGGPAGGVFPQFTRDGVPCSVSLAGGQPLAFGAAVSFAAPDVRSCVEAGMRLGFGVAGVANIVMVTPNWGVVAVTCFRTPDNLRDARCHQQPPPGG